MKRATKGGIADLRIGMLETPQGLETRQDFAAAIAQTWQRSVNGFVQVGRYLREAKERLAHGEFEAMIESDLPFSASVGRRLRQAADLVDSGKVPQEALPDAYSIVAEIGTLSDEDRETALEQGVIRPDMTRSDLTDFKRTVREPAPPTAPAPPEERRVVLGHGLQALLDAPAEAPPEDVEEEASAPAPPVADIEERSAPTTAVTSWSPPLSPPAASASPPPAPAATIETTRKALQERLAQLEAQAVAVARQIAQVKGQLEDLNGARW